MADKPTDKPGKQSFVPPADRPEVRLKSTTRISDLTVRDLATILGQLGTRKDFWDGKDWQKDDFDGGLKWKDSKEFKEFKEFKEGKEFKEFKEFREVKPGDKEKDKEKEFKEFKDGKAEKGEFQDGRFFEQQPDPDPRIEQVIRALSGMSAKVDQLADQMEALKKGKG